MATDIWGLYEQRTSFVIGFHGCRRVHGEVVLAGEQKHLKKSSEKFDWLGSGIYFWEGNPERALQWAQKKYGEEAFVIGAVLDLGRCLDLLDSNGLQQVKDAYATLAAAYQAAGEELPVNSGKDKYKGRRVLDCLVINSLHDYLKNNGQGEYDSVRAMFPEGEELYPGAGFLDKNHIQVCICNMNCIKGYFRPIQVK